MFNRAHNQDLLDPKLTESVFRWSRAAASAPVFFFAVSMPIAFLSPGLAACAGSAASRTRCFYLDRRKPPGAEELLE